MTRKEPIDPEIVAFEEAVLRSLEQGRRGEYAAVHTPEQMKARARGRPLGSVQATTKQAVKLRLDADVLDAIKATGSGWQTRINDMLRASLKLAGRV